MEEVRGTNGIEDPWFARVFSAELDVRGRMLLPWMGNGGGDGQVSRKPTCVSSPSSSQSTRVVEAVVDGWVSSHLR